MTIRLKHLFHEHHWEKIADGCGPAVTGGGIATVAGALDRCECRPGKFAYRFMPKDRYLEPTVAEVVEHVTA